MTKSVVNCFLCVLFCEYRYARVLYSPAKAFTFQRFHARFYAHSAHLIWVLRHRAEQVAVTDQVHNRIGLIEAYADDICVSARFDGIAGTRGRTFVTSENANYALSDIVFRNALGLRRTGSP